MDGWTYRLVERGKKTEAATKSTSRNDWLTAGWLLGAAPLSVSLSPRDPEARARSGGAPGVLTSPMTPRVVDGPPQLPSSVPQSARGGELQRPTAEAGPNRTTPTSNPLPPPPPAVLGGDQVRFCLRALLES
jgi:hypothetical protein